MTGVVSRTIYARWFHVSRFTTLGQPPAPMNFPRFIRGTFIKRSSRIILRRVDSGTSLFSSIVSLASHHEQK